MTFSKGKTWNLEDLRLIDVQDVSLTPTSTQLGCAFPHSALETLTDPVLVRFLSAAPLLSNDEQDVSVGD